MGSLQRSSTRVGLVRGMPLKLNTRRMLEAGEGDVPGGIHRRRCGCLVTLEAARGEGGLVREPFARKGRCTRLRDHCLPIRWAVAADVKSVGAQ